VHDALHGGDIPSINGLPKDNELQRYVDQEQLHQFLQEVRITLLLQIAQVRQNTPI